MGENSKVLQGTAAWFEMVGAIMTNAASKTKLAPDLNIALVERYTDGIRLANGLYQGIRLEINDGQFSFRVGVEKDERADITVEVTAAAARRLNLVHGEEYQAERQAFLKSGEMRVDGDPARMGSWMDATHDQTVDRTC